MRNSEFFSEAQIVANHALNYYKDPFGAGIEQGIKYLRQKRYHSDNERFSDNIFDKYADHYRVMAKALIKEWIKYRND